MESKESNLINAREVAAKHSYLARVTSDAEWMRQTARVLLTHEQRQNIKAQIQAMTPDTPEETVREWQMWDLAAREAPKYMDAVPATLSEALERRDAYEPTDEDLESIEAEEFLKDGLNFVKGLAYGLLISVGFGVAIYALLLAFGGGK